jgi:glycosyltransferase involved in cell wall biosynthesis
MARICMIAFTHYPTDSRVRREAEALSDRKDMVDVICLKGKNKDSVKFMNGVRLLEVSVPRYRGSSALLYLIQYFIFFMISSIWLVFLHLKNRYQVIQVHTMPDFMVFTGLIPKLLGAKVILDVHDLMPELYQSKFGLRDNHWMIRFITWMERMSIKFADKAIAVHKPHLDTLTRHGNPEAKFIILLNLADPKLFYQPKKSSHNSQAGFRLIYHGMVAKRNGLQTAFYAIAKITREIPEIRFQIYGEGDDIPTLKNLAKELNLNEYIEIHEGYIPMKKLVPIILEADVGMVPILYDEFTKFMLPVKLLEYVTLGLPVIVSRTETIEAYFDDTMVQYCQPGNADDWAEKIIFLYKNPAYRLELSKNSQKFSKNYEWDFQKQSYYALIDGLAAQSFIPSPQNS